VASREGLGSVELVASSGSVKAALERGKADILTMTALTQYHLKYHSFKPCIAVTAGCYVASCFSGIPNLDYKVFCI
jgi:hypothetical protein